MKKISIIILAVMLASGLYSCNKDTYIFEETPSARLQARLAEAKTTLQAQEYGWTLDMFPSSEREYGGYAFTLKFHGDTVDVQSELSVDNGTVLTSLYKLTTDNGATLSFDTYNTFLHFFSTPASYLYTAYGGEFEYIVCDVQKDLIKIKGSKTGNIMYLRALKEPATKYLDKVIAMDETFQKWLPSFGDENSEVYVRSLERNATYTDLTTGSEESVAISVSSEGIRFYGGIKLCGETVTEMKPVFENGQLVGCTSDSGKLIPWSKPEGWEAYEDMDFSGTWNLCCHICNSESVVVPAKIPVTFTRYEINGEKGFEMHGVYPSNTIKLNYLEREGKINLRSYFIQRIPTKYPLMYQAPARRQYTTSPAITTFYLYGGQYNDRGMMFAKNDEGGYDWVNNKVYTNVDYNCIVVKVFDEDLYNSLIYHGEEWRVKGTEGTPSPYYSIVYEVDKLEKVK